MSYLDFIKKQFIYFIGYAAVVTFGYYISLHYGLRKPISITYQDILLFFLIYILFGSYLNCARNKKCA